MRRGVNMVYIVENNGVYGLTKGQFSATVRPRFEEASAASSTPTRRSIWSAWRCSSAPPSSARSFSGDKDAADAADQGARSSIKGAAFIDCISPCVAFNNHAGSTKSFDYVREHNEAVNRLDVMPEREEITADYAPGTVETVQQHDGSILRLRKNSADYDARDRLAAMTHLQERHAAGEIATGLLYLEPDAGDLHADLDTVKAPFNALGESELCPGGEALDRFNAALR